MPGIFFKGYQALEASHQVDTVVLDKTGTVTTGTMAVTDVDVVPGVDRSSVLLWAGALEQASEHLVARAITAAARAEFGTLPDVERFMGTPGLGARGTVGSLEISVGRAELVATSGNVVPKSLEESCARWEAKGNTAVLVSRDQSVVGALGLSDTVRPHCLRGCTPSEAAGAPLHPSDR